MTERDQTPPHGSTAVGGQPAYTPPSEAHGVSSGAHGPVGASENYYTAPKYTTTPIAQRRPDAFAALLLVLAGVAAAVSLLLRWVNGASESGLDLVRDGFDRWGESFGDVFSSGFWQPLTIVLGGGVLFVLGLLMFVPAKTHRFLGILALVVSLAAAAAVLVPLADAGFDFSEFDLGFWFAIAVPALGLLGSLKALLSGPKYASTAPLT
ncbi:hypothetical protein GCM10010531_02210 [Blastococcus jejuensis]|uniref:Tryptophan-associated transmembrane protein (Trp_oprn_chp) n=1 Tax=Blastococcus jejuensis TaxID=351224 RepID=A0ABP6NRA6_9ACTN